MLTMLLGSLQGGWAAVGQGICHECLHDDEYDTAGHQLIPSNWILKVEKYLNEPT